MSVVSLQKRCSLIIYSPQISIYMVLRLHRRAPRQPESPDHCFCGLVLYLKLGPAIHSCSSFQSWLPAGEYAAQGSLLFLLLFQIFFLCRGVLPAFMSMYHMCLHCPAEVRKGYGILGNQSYGMVLCTCILQPHQRTILNLQISLPYFITPTGLQLSGAEDYASESQKKS